MAFRLTVILNQSDNSDEPDSGEDINGFSESSEVLDTGDDDETASTVERVIFETCIHVHAHYMVQTIFHVIFIMDDNLLNCFK